MQRWGNSAGRTADVLVDDDRYRVPLTPRASVRRLILSEPFESKIVGQENPRRRVEALPPRPGSKQVMVRPRTENVTRGQVPSVSLSDARLAAALLSRLRQTHPFTHHQAGFRSRRLAPLTWRRMAAVRQPVVK